MICNGGDDDRLWVIHAYSIMNFTVLYLNCCQSRLRTCVHVRIIKVSARTRKACFLICMRMRLYSCIVNVIVVRMRAYLGFRGRLRLDR